MTPRFAEAVRRATGRGVSTAICGHRGDPSSAPENTLAGFRAAIDAGVDAVEFDVRLSSDRIPVVIHDPDVRRTTDGRGRVAALDAATLRTFDAGARYGAAFRGARVPFLDEALETLRGRALPLIEVKIRLGRDPEAGERIVRVIRSAGAVDASVVIAADGRAAAVLKAIEPRLLVAVLTVRRITLRRVRGLAVADGADAHWRSLTAGGVARYARAGKFIMPWTVNDPHVAARLAAWGVDAIITDRPSVVERSVGW